MKEVIVAQKLMKEYAEYGKKGMFLEKISSMIAVNEVDLTVYEGDFIAVMGPSGSGKSTLINMLSTMDTPTKGKVFIDGKSVHSLKDYEIAKIRYKTIGFVFQDFNLLELLTCEENIATPLILNNENPDEIKNKTLEISEILGIDNLLDKYPMQCSGGEQQRIATARALVSGPRVLVADEPTGNLDSANSRRVMSFFKEINEERNITILMVTHDAMVASYAKKVLYLRDGRIETIVEKGNKKQREFFQEVLELVSEDAIF